MTLTKVGNLETQTYEDKTADATIEQASTAADVTLYGIEVDNTGNSTAVFLKVWFLDSAPTLGTTAPHLIFKIPASGRRFIPLGFGVEAVDNDPIGLITTTTGDFVFFAVVTDPGTAGTTSPANAVGVVLKTT